MIQDDSTTDEDPQPRIRAGLRQARQSVLSDSDLSPVPRETIARLEQAACAGTGMRSGRGVL
jgi:hypothetical protein